MNYFENQKIMLVSGGTFGHIYPALMFQKLYGGDIFLDSRSIRFFPRENTQNITFFNYLNKYNVFSIASNIYFFWKNLKNYDVIVTFGGFSTFPAVIASMFRKINRFFHEQNVVLGLVNKIAYYLRFKPLLSWKNTMGLCKHYTKDPIYFGIPIEKPINNNNQEEKKIILVVPGSGGSEFFDKHISTILKKITENNEYKIVFIAKNKEYVSNILGDNHEVTNFILNIDEYISKCSIFIGRSGAGIISKIINYQKPAIIIPLMHSANDHQYLNAKHSHIPYITEDKIYLFEELFKEIENKKILYDSNLILNII